MLNGQANLLTRIFYRFKILNRFITMLKFWKLRNKGRSHSILLSTLHNIESRLSFTRRHWNLFLKALHQTLLRSHSHWVKLTLKQCNWNREGGKHKKSHQPFYPTNVKTSHYSGIKFGRTPDNLSLAGCSSSILVNVQQLFMSITQLLVVRPVIYTRKLQPKPNQWGLKLKALKTREPWFRCN